MKKLIISCSMLMLTSMAHSNSETLNDNELDFMIEQAVASGFFDDNTQSTKSGTGFVTVGSDNTCDYHTGSTKIQNAINTVSDGTEIRIAHGTYEENLFINSKSVKLLGGYADCSAADNNNYSFSSTSTKIIPTTGSNKPVIKVTGDSARYLLTLRNLTIENGEGEPNNDYPGGGISFNSADYGVIIQDSIIQKNDGTFGGGISVRTGKTNIDIIGSSVMLNSALDGGGIYCNGSNNSITLLNKLWYELQRPSANMLIIGNNAYRDGGGSNISGSCQLTSYVGGTINDNNGGGFVLNKAGRHGGGIYVALSGKINLYGHQNCSGSPISICHGNNNKPNSVSSNTADEDADNDGHGGAIYATSANTKVIASNVEFKSNRAYHGGAVYVTNGAEFETYAVNHQNCWENGRCNQYTSNRASINNGYGGAFYANDGGKISVLASHIERNRADYGSGFYIINSGSELNLEGSYVVNNGEPGAANYLNRYPLRVNNDATAKINFSTIADNNVPVSSASIGNNLSTLQMYGNIVHEQGSTAALDSVSAVETTQFCNIVNALGDMYTPSNVTDDPSFIDRNNNDYHIDARFSPAVDYCLGTLANLDNKDTDGDRRSWDDYTVTNIYGPYDAGADETYDNDIIFKDDLE